MPSRSEAVKAPTTTLRTGAIRRIVVLRGGALGDLVVSLPALAALRGRYPAAELELLGSLVHRRLLLPRRRLVDRVVALPSSVAAWLESRRATDDPEVTGALDCVAARPVDLAVQLHGGGARSNLLVARLRAQQSIGLRAPDAPPLDRWIPYRYFQSEVDRGLEVAALAGAPALLERPMLPLLTEDLAAARRFVPDSSRLAILHPGASDPRRRWPPDRFALVGDELARRDVRVVIVGTGSERHLAASVATAMRQPALDLSGRTSVRALVGLLARATIVVANDSGPLHVANAIGAATVGLYWGPNLINAGPRGRARSRVLLSWRLDCPVCGVDCLRASCQHEASFVDRIPTQAVVEEALDLLDGCATASRVEASAATEPTATSVQPEVVAGR